MVQRLSLDHASCWAHAASIDRLAGRCGGGRLLLLLLYLWCEVDMTAQQSGENLEVVGATIVFGSSLKQELACLVDLFILPDGPADGYPAVDASPVRTRSRMNLGYEFAAFHRDVKDAWLLLDIACSVDFESPVFGFESTVAHGSFETVCIDADKI